MIYNKIAAFTRDIDHEECVLILAQYEQFEEAGAIGSCELRTRAEELSASLGVASSSVTMMMQQLVFEICREYAHQYLDLCDR